MCGYHLWTVPYGRGLSSKWKIYEGELKSLCDLFEQDPGTTRQNSYGRAGRDFSQPHTNHLVNLCSCTVQGRRATVMPFGKTSLAELMLSFWGGMKCLGKKERCNEKILSPISALSCFALHWHSKTVFLHYSRFEFGIAHT